MSGNPSDFLSTLSRSESKEVSLTIYNMLHRKKRTIKMIPNRNWPQADSLLGILIRYEDYSNAHERVLRIADIKPNSPAQLAELIIEDDYILGSPQYLYKDVYDLSNFIELTQESAIKSLEIGVFNIKTKEVRSTLILPNKNWGGKGFLGCEFGLGILNALPYIYEEENQKIVEDSFAMNNLDDAITQNLKKSSPNEIFDIAIINKKQENIDISDNNFPEANDIRDKKEINKAEDEKGDGNADADADADLNEFKKNLIMVSTKDASFSPLQVHNQRMKFILEKRERNKNNNSGIASAIKQKVLLNPFDFQDIECYESSLAKDKKNYFLEIEKIDYSKELHEATNLDIIEPINNFDSSDHQNNKEKSKNTISSNNEHHPNQQNVDLNELNNMKAISGDIPINEISTNEILTEEEEEKSGKISEIHEELSNDNINNENEINEKLEENESVIDANTEIDSNKNDQVIPEPSIKETQKYKIIVRYTFFSKKINGDYLINSTDLFDIDDLKTI